MKTKILLTTAITLFLAYFSFAQCLVLHHEGEQLAPNAEITVQGDPDLETIVELDVQNTCGYDIDVLVQRYEESMVSGSYSVFCWGLCFAPDVSLSPFPTTVPANFTNTTDFSGHYFAQGNEGIAVISYVFFDQNNPDDSVKVTVNYNCNPVGIAENSTRDENSVKIYPTPAQNNITLNLDQAYSDVDFQILDITGSLVKEVRQVGNGSTVQVNDLAEGLYLYRAFADGNLLKTGRLVINR